MTEITIDLVKVEAQYPIGPEVPVITLTKLDQLEVMISSLGLSEEWHRDARAYAQIIEKNGKSSMAVMYQNSPHEHNQPPHVYVVLCLSCFREELDIAASFVFHQKSACKLARHFADELFKASEAKLQALPGTQLYERHD